MSDQQREIYQSEAERYEALISREDYQGNIPHALDEIINVDGLDIVDLGAGTGRLTMLLAPRARSISSFDISDHMLAVTRSKLTSLGLNNWQVEVADHRNVPLADDSVDDGYKSVQALIGVLTGLGSFLDKAVQAVRENDLGSEQHFMLFAELRVIFGKTCHQCFQPIQPGLA